MKKKNDVFLGLLIAALLLLTMACPTPVDGGNGGGGGVTLPQNSGTNEVIGKTLYLSDWRNIVFSATGTTFKQYYNDELDSEGAYSYNSENKTITLAIEYVYWTGTKMNKTQIKNAAGAEFDKDIADLRANFDDQVLWMATSEIRDSNDFWNDWYEAGEPQDEVAYLKSWLTQKGYDSATLIADWKNENPTMNTADKYINAMLAEMGFNNLAAYKEYYLSMYFDEEFAPKTYDYQFATDNSLLVQEKLPANKGSNELSGKTFTSTWSSDISYTFTENTYTKNIYTITEDWYNSPQTVETGTYAYDSTAKEVWLRPEKINDKTMPQYYTESYYNNAAEKAAEKAADTNSRFRAEREDYSLDSNSIG